MMLDVKVVLKAMADREKVIHGGDSDLDEAAMPEFDEDDRLLLFTFIVASALCDAIAEPDDFPVLFWEVFVRGVEMGRELERRAP